MVVAYPDQEIVISTAENPFNGKNWLTVTPEDYVRAYEYLELKPRTGRLLTSDREACAIGVQRICINGGVYDMVGKEDYHIRFPTLFECAVQRGFDYGMNEYDHASSYEDSGVRRGYQIGRAVSKRMFAEKVTI